jgi:hypothetical protein
MNERVKELANKVNWGSDVTYPELAKFAELIVRECAELCDINDREQGDILREHFGVE